MKIRWSNIPIPEAYVVAVIAAGLVHIFVPRSIVPPSVALLIAGLILLAAGIALIAWAVMAVRDNDIEHPAMLVMTGPFALSRNPMYLGWTGLCLGIALLVNSLWIVIAVAVAWLFTHWVTIPGEERFLQGEFGQAYADYCRRVRRYL